MTDTEFIKNIRPIEYSNYAKVSSREKLIAYAIDYLNQNNIQTTFNNVCIAAFKLFPEKFYFSDEYPEYPHIEMLNRTLLHLRPKERNYATGSSRTLYILTPLGKEVVKTVKADMSNSNFVDIVKPKMDVYKQSQSGDFEKLINSKGYIIFRESHQAEIDFIWEMLGITPYTQIEKTKKKLKNIQNFAQSVGNSECIMYINEILRQL